MHRRYADTIIYEVHVKGFTMRHPGVPPELRGTYAGLGHEAAIGHLVDLGIAAVELLPVHEFVPEAWLAGRGLTNYWGYNTIGYFAPEPGLFGRGARRAGRPPAAGIEVLLDVVFNHTAEGNQLGPTPCYRGLDNPAYYRLDRGEPLTFTVPVTRAAPGGENQAWHTELDTYEGLTPDGKPPVHPGEQVTIGPRSIVVCRAGTVAGSGVR